MNILKNIFKKKDSPIKSYADFWNWFQQHEKTFFKVIKEKGDIEKIFFDPLTPKLRELKDGYFFLTGMLNDGTAELILTADGAIDNIVFVEELVAAAPRISGWLFTALKPAMDIKNVSIQMAGNEFKAENISFYSNDDDYHPDEIDVTIVHHDMTDANKKDITIGTFIFLDNFLGELNFATTIDNIEVIGKKNAQKELVPIEKLKHFLIWREKEFVEKYEGARHNTENDDYTMLEAQLDNGNALVAVVNIELLEWDSKPSHPWILNVEIKYNGAGSNGMPDNDTYQLLVKIEEEILTELKDTDGYLNIGRQTANSVREIYFACKDFRLPSKVLYGKQQQYAATIEIEYEIYKDKYWQSFDRFIQRG